MFIQKRRIVAEDVIEDQVDDVAMDDVAEGDAADVQVAPEATDLLFEAEDVAELVAEVTGQPVEVNVEDDFVEFAVGEDVYTIEAEGDEEILEASTKILKNKRTVSASTKRRPAAKREVAASKQTRPLRKVTRR